jgi:Aspartyl protease
MHSTRRTTTAFAALSCFALVNLTGCAAFNPVHSQPNRLQIPSGDAALPIDWWCDFAMVQVYVDERGPFSFLLDTGAGISVVSPHVAALLPEQTFPIRQNARGSRGTRVSIRNALSIRDLKAGPVHFREFDALIMDLANVSDAFGTTIDGILGCPLFEDALLRIDFPNREVRVQLGTLEGPERDDLFRFAGKKRPVVGVTIGSKTHPVVVDTGSGGGLSLNESAFQGQKYQNDPVLASTSVGIGGKPRTLHEARLSGTATVGPHVLDQPVIRSAGNSSLLGVTILRNFVVTFDRKNDLILLERDDEVPLTSPPSRSTGIGLRRGTTAWSIWKILPFASEQAQELRPGDIVTKIANMPVEDFDCESFSEIHKTRDEITIEIERNAERQTLTLPVIEIVP